MNQAQLDQWMSRITYKPGWELRAAHVFSIHGDMVRITVGCTGPSSTNPQLVRPFHHARLYSEPRNERELAVDVFLTIEELEAHEQLEWFRINGEPIQPPHVDGRAVFHLK